MANDPFARLLARFPGLYGSEMLFDFSAPEGWFELLWELSEKLEPLGVRAEQVKSKFGALRFYYDPWRPEADAFIRVAEERSARTCEVCGKAGKSSEQGWIVTRCDEHAVDPIPKGRSKRPREPY